MQREALDKLREAGRIASAVRESGAGRIVAGASLREVCEAVEEEIRRRGGEPAFPTQSSRNHVAAHYCPSPEDQTVYADGDLAKLDIGVHVDGYVVDTALTVNVGDEPRNRPLAAASREALTAAIAAAGPDVPIREVSAAIERTIRGHGFRPMRNLCGHGVGRYAVHCPPAIPNTAEDSAGVLAPGVVVAIEPFATDGGGLVAEQGTPEVFRLDPLRAPREWPGLDRELLAALHAFRGLPFARRGLARFSRSLVDESLGVLQQAGLIQAYAPLVETGGRPVAQAEHTVYVSAEGVEVLTG